MAAEHEERPAGAPAEPAETAPREDDDATARARAIEEDPSQDPSDEDLKRIKGG